MIRTYFGGWHPSTYFNNGNPSVRTERKNSASSWFKLSNNVTRETYNENLSAQRTCKESVRKTESRKSATLASSRNMAIVQEMAFDPLRVGMWGRGVTFRANSISDGRGWTAGGWGAGSLGMHRGNSEVQCTRGHALASATVAAVSVRLTRPPRPTGRSRLDVGASPAASLRCRFDGLI